MQFFLLHQHQPLRWDRHKNQHFQIDTNVINDGKLECHINFDNPALASGDLD